MFPFPVSRRIWSEWEILSPSLSPISSIWRRSDHLRPSADQTTHCADRNIVRINRFCWSWRQRLAINCQLWSYHKVIRSDGGKWGVTTCLPQASNRRLAVWSWPFLPDCVSKEEKIWWTSKHLKKKLFTSKRYHKKVIQEKDIWLACGDCRSTKNLQEFLFCGLVQKIRPISVSLLICTSRISQSSWLG